MEHLTLEKLILRLEKIEDKNKILSEGLSYPHSYRGSYEYLAFELTPNISIQEMLEEAKKSVGKIFGGYKGGEFCMDEDTLIYLAEFGHTGEPLTQEKLEEILKELND